MKKVCPICATWILALMLIIPGSVLHAEDPPPTQAQAVSTARVPPALRQSLASSLNKAVSIGAKAIPAPPTGSYGVVAEADGAGGIFRDSNSDAEAWLGAEQVGVHGFGALAGGHFEDSDATGYAWVGHADAGIEAGGSLAGGLFVDSDDDGEALVGHGNYGIEARGSEMGGYFEDRDGSGFAHLGWGNTGVFGRGNVAGGAFDDGDGSGYARAGYGDRGVDAGGNEMGGYFEDSDGTGFAHLGWGDTGVFGRGNVAGGVFEDRDGSGYAKAGYGNRGVEAGGTEIGGYFEDSDGSGYAKVGMGDYGISAAGSAAGGIFRRDPQSIWTSVAILATGDTGIRALGGEMGGYFEDKTTSGWAKVAYETQKIEGTGAVSFIQNHPYDSSSVIVYTAPEGDEVATYTRGTARLVGGETTVRLGDTFRWVTNPDIGLTAHVTPVGEFCDLYVVEKSTEQITVRSRDGLDCAFDFLVYGLRIGFEEISPVMEKDREAYIPSMASHRDLILRRPDLRKFNSLERFRSMRHALGKSEDLDLSRAHALRDAIIEFDPSVHKLPQHPGHEERPGGDLALEDGQRGVQRVRSARVDHDQQLSTDHSDLSAVIPADGGGNIYAPSLRPPSREVATLVHLSESVEPGDVLVIDRETAGLMRQGFEGHDSGVVGVVLASQSPALSEGEIEVETALHAEVAMAGVVKCKVDATYGAIWPGNLLATSPTSGHAMRTDSPLPGTIVGKALEPLEEGTGTIRILVMLQ